MSGQLTKEIEMNTQTRFENALAALRAQGLHAELNTTACCRSCACADTKGKGVLAHFEKAARVDGTLKTRRYGGEEIQTLNFNFNIDDLKVARACRKAFRANGFTVTWSGSKYDCVQVHLI